MEHFSKDQLKRARKTDLYEFLSDYHWDDVKKEGDSLRLKANHSVSVKRGYCGFKDFETDESGNSVDFLVKYLGYSLDEAIFILIGETSEDAYDSDDYENSFDSNKISNNSNNIISQDLKKTDINEKKDIHESIKEIIFPEKTDGPYKNLFAYLKKRGISIITIQDLVDRNLIYQENNHNNIVFINPEKDWAELHGTYSYPGKSFHGMISNCRLDGFWYIKTSDIIKKAYICEAAIDAISLYEMDRMEHKEKDSMYISIGGVSKQSAIDRIKVKYRTIMAVDNDEAGSECRRRNAELESRIPFHKDWNDDLLKIREIQKKEFEEFKDVF